MPVASDFTLLVSMSRLVSVFDESIMHIVSPALSKNPSGIIGGSPRIDPMMDDGLNWPGPYSWYCVRVLATVSM